MLRPTDSHNFSACLPAFRKTRIHRSSLSSRRKVSASLSSTFHFDSRPFLRSSSSLHAEGKGFSALDRKLDKVIGRKSNEARRGCILAKSAIKFESSCAFAKPGDVRGESAEKAAGKLKRCFAWICAFVGASSMMVSSSCTSRPIPSGICSGEGDICLFSSISKISRLRRSASCSMSPRTTFHSSSHSIASSTCILTVLRWFRTLFQSPRTTSICSTSASNSSGGTSEISNRS